MTFFLDKHKLQCYEHFSTMMNLHITAPLFIRFQANALGLCRLALHITFPTISFAADTVDGVHLFGLSVMLACRLSLRETKPKLQEVSYPQVLIGGFLPFFSHRPWWRFGESVNAKENDCRDSNTNCTIRQHLCPLSRWIFCTGSVWSESNPPSYIKSAYALCCTTSDPCY